MPVDLPVVAAEPRAEARGADRPGGGAASWIFRRLRTVTQVALAVVTVAVALIAAGTVFGTWGLEPVLTGSMRPGVQPGDLVLLVPEPVASVRVGQVLDFQPPGEGGASVVHRVVAVTPGRGGPVIRTKGDANNVADSWKARLSGPRAWRVRGVIPKLGYVSVAEHNPTARLVIEGALIGGGLVMALAAVWGRTEVDDDDELVPAGVVIG